MYAERGIKTHIIKSGKFKGAGAEGAEVTQEELDEIQRMADSINDLFANAVAKGRSMTMSQVAKVNDGRVWLAEEAQGLGLIDGVESFDVAMNKLRVEARPARSTKSAKAKMAVAAL
jgi:protease-4